MITPFETAEYILYSNDVDTNERIRPKIVSTFKIKQYRSF